MASLSISTSTTELTFAVHVFISHDPNIASIFLSSSYAGLSESIFNPPPLPGVTPYHTLRHSLGRYVLPSSLPASTPLSRIGEILVTEFGIPERLQAFFTVFPQFPDPKGEYPPWHERPLPRTTSIEEAWTLDEEDREQGKVHLVLVTTATALSEITGVEFLAEELERRIKARVRLASFNHAFPLGRLRSPRFMREVRRWRYCRYALAYLSSDRTRHQEDEAYTQEKITEFEAMEREARKQVERMAREWEALVERKDPGKIELTVDQVEEKYQEIRKRKRELVAKWEELKAEKKKENEQGKGLVEGAPFEELPMAQIVVPARSPVIPSQEDAEAMGGEKVEAVAGENAKGGKTADEQLAADEDADDKIPAKTQMKNSIYTISLRDAYGALRKDTDGFTITSGVLLWSHIHPIYYSTIQPPTAFTNNAATIPPMLPGGTIMQHVYTYKSAARNGRWKVRRVYSNLCGFPGGDGDPTTHVGWVYCHEDLDPLEVVKRCSSISGGFGGISNRNVHADKDVLFIGRYDWSHHWHSTDPNFSAQFQQFAEEALGPVPADFRDLSAIGGYEPATHFADRRGGYFMALDADGFGHDFVKMFADQCPLADRDTVEQVFVKEGGKRFGSYVSLQRTEYEFAWLVFSGAKHDDHKEADELVAIVYDGWYEVLEGSEHAVEHDPE